MKVTKCVLFIEDKGYFKGYRKSWSNKKEVVFTDTLQEARVYNRSSAADISVKTIQKLLGLQLVKMKYKTVPVALVELK